MPRSINEILSHADELADKFEAFEPSVGAHANNDAATLNALREAVVARGAAERAVFNAVLAARRESRSWASIGVMLGTSGEAARQRYKAIDEKLAAEADRWKRVVLMLDEAGFTAAEVTEFVGMFEFAVAMTRTGHVGLVGNVHWTPDKAVAFWEILQEFGTPTKRMAGDDERVVGSAEICLCSSGPWRRNNVRFTQHKAQHEANC